MLLMEIQIRRILYIKNSRENESRHLRELRVKSVCELHTQGFLVAKAKRKVQLVTRFTGQWNKNLSTA